jgi:hypothetical protein
LHPKTAAAAAVGSVPELSHATCVGGAAESALLRQLDIASPAEALAWMLHPVSLETFFSEHWEKKPLVIRRKKAAYYTSLFSTAALDSILRHQYMKYTQNVDITSYTDGQRSFVSARLFGFFLGFFL